MFTLFSTPIYSFRRSNLFNQSTNCYREGHKMFSLNKMLQHTKQAGIPTIILKIIPHFFKHDFFPSTNSGVLQLFLFQLLQLQSWVIYLTFFLFLEVCLYCYKLSPQHFFYSVTEDLGCCVFIFIRFCAYFDFFSDFFCDLLFRSKLFSLHMLEF